MSKKTLFLIFAPGLQQPLKSGSKSHSRQKGDTDCRWNLLSPADSNLATPFVAIAQGQSASFTWERQVKRSSIQGRLASDSTLFRSYSLPKPIRDSKCSGRKVNEKAIIGCSQNSLYNPSLRVRDGRRVFSI